MSSKSKKVRITLVKSPIGCSTRQKRTIKALGLRRLYQFVVQEDNAVTRGMVEKIGHLVEVEDYEAA